MKTESILVVFLVGLLNHARAISIEDCPSYLPRDRFLRVHDNSCYSFKVSQERDFPTAELECESRKGHLVIVSDLSKQSFLYNTLRHDFNYNGVVWIGLSDENSEGEWEWVDGSRPEYTRWAPNQPGLLAGLEDCAVMDISDSGRWHDYACEGVLFFDEEHYFVCQYPLTQQATDTPMPTVTTPVEQPTTVTILPDVTTTLPGPVSTGDTFVPVTTTPPQTTTPPSATTAAPASTSTPQPSVQPTTSVPTTAAAVTTAAADTTAAAATTVPVTTQPPSVTSVVPPTSAAA